MSEELKEKQKISRLSLLSVSGLAVTILLLLLNLPAGRNLHSGFLIFLVIASLFTAIAALLEIYRSSERLKGRGIAISVIITIISMLSFFSAMNEPRTMVNDCKDKIGSLSVYFLHLNKLPQNPYQWCDFLIIQEGSRPDMFICPGSDVVEGESSYALNKNVYEKKVDNLPPDIVLLFETNYGKGLVRDTPIEQRRFFSDPNFDESDRNNIKNQKVYKERWNQVGGPEIIEIGNHRQSKGSNILFADGSVEFVEIQRIPELRWKIEGKEEFPAFLLESNKGAISKGWIAVIAAVILFGAVLLLIKYGTKKYRFIAIIISLISCGFGWFFGLSSSIFYLSDKYAQAAPIAGAIVGLLTGIAYITFLANIPADFKLSGSFRGYIVSTGLAAGVICSTIVHLIAMAVNRTINPLGLLAALPFGIITGLILGLISWAVLKSLVLKDLVQNTQKTNTAKNASEAG